MREFFRQISYNSFWINLILLLILGSFPVYSQDNKDETTIPKFYAKTVIGYGFGINGDYATTNTDGKRTVSNWMLGNGMNGIACIGYNFGNNLGIELSGGYMYGFQNSIGKTVIKGKKVSGLDAKGQMWQISPSILYNVSIGKTQFYQRTGLLIGQPEFNVQTENAWFLNPPVSFNSDRVQGTRVYGNLAIGLQTGIGCVIPLKSNWISLFAEVTCNAISFSPARASLYSYSVNGKDTFADLPVGAKEIIYKRSYPANQTNSIYDSLPLVYQQDKFGFGSLNLMVGIKIKLGNSHVSGMTALRDFKRFSYLRINYGYGYTTDGDYFYNFDDINGLSTVEYSGGNGWYSGIGYGYMISSNFGIDLGLNYIQSSKFEYGNKGKKDTIKHTIYGNMWTIVPALVFTSKVWKFEPYARFGAILATATVNSTSDYTDSVKRNHLLWKYEGGLSVGFNTVLGLSLPLGNKFDIFAEASFNTLYYSPAKGTFEEGTLNGVDYLSSYNTQSKKCDIQNFIFGK